MAVEDIHSFLQVLEKEGQLHKVHVEVNWDQEVPAITDRVCKRPGGGPGLLFNRVVGYPTPVCTNLFGSSRRMRLALGNTDADIFGNRLLSAMKGCPGSTSLQKLASLLERKEYQPQFQQNSPCQQRIVETEPDVGAYLPALRTWPKDGGRYLTLPMVVTQDPDSGVQNFGMYRVQLLGGNQLAIHWGPFSDGARHHQKNRNRGDKTPVAVVIGGPPALLYASGAPVPAGVDEATFASFLLGKPVSMAKTLTHGLAVPAGADYVLEGYVEKDETVEEGPFGNHTGFYDPPKPAALFKVQTLTCRKDPVYVCTVVGPPPMENSYMAQFSERLFLPLLQLDHPRVLEIHQPVEGIFHQCTFVSVKKDGPGQGKDVIRQLWDGPWLPRARLLAVFDEGTNLTESNGLLWHVLNRMTPASDLMVKGEQVGIDATSKVSGEDSFTPGRLPIVESPHIQQLLANRWAEYGL
ncbi:UbiD family decarboxylase [Desulfuromonas sp. AOP6]|uniref:UbiD family decarboxylase n=1 Tax=Desulfuromonas sp. AOP6 TaxID=1566351 RepID=UPI001BCAC202|nr:UbiD family decarboxylase [Desulfuromonas sp. AOP6]